MNYVDDKNTFTFFFSLCLTSSHGKLARLFAHLNRTKVFLLKHMFYTISLKLKAYTHKFILITYKQGGRGLCFHHILS